MLDVDGDGRAASPATRRRGNSEAYGGGHVRRPRRRARRRPPRRRAPRRDVQVALPAPGPAARLQAARTSSSTDGARPARGRGSHVDADRPFRIYADGDPIGELPATIRAVPAALRVLLPERGDRCSASKVAARARRRRALPARRARRDEPARPAAPAPGAARDRRGWPRGCARGSVVISRDERQDDDGRDGRRDPRARGARASSTTAPGRTWPAASRPRCRPRARGGAWTAISASSRSTSSGSTASSPSCTRARCCWPTSSATSSTATASSRRSPTAGRQVVGRDARARSSSTPTTRSSPTSGATATSALYFGVQDDEPRAGGHGARVGLQALPPLRRPVRLRRDLPRPPRPLPLPELRRAAPGARGAAERRRPRRARAARASRCARRRARSPSRSRCPASTTSTTRSAPPALALALGAPLRRRRGRAGRRSQAAFGRAETLRVGGRELTILLVKNPAGANEVLRTLALDPGEHDLLGVLNDRTADGRDVSLGLGRRLRGPRAARAARDVQRHARRGARAAPEVRGRADRPHRGAAAARDARSTRRCAGDGGRLVALPTYTAMLELRDAARRARRRAGVLRVTPAQAAVDLARRRVRRLRRRPAAVARARRRRGRRRRARRRRGHRPRRAATWPRRGHPRRRARHRRPRCCARCGSARPGCPSETVVGDARDFDLGERFGLIIVPMQTVQLLGGPAGRAAFLRLRASPPRSRAASWRSRSPTRSRPSTPSTTSRRRPTSARSTARCLRQPARGHPRRGRARRDRARARDGRHRRPAHGRGRRHPPRPPRARDARGRGRAAGLRVLPRLRIPATDEYVGSDRGGARVPEPGCACARCIPTS